MRPIIATQPATSPEEAFQNTALRPILKQHHAAVVAVMRYYLKKRKVRYEQLTSALRTDKIKELVTRDNRLRGLLFGMVVGHFTPEEITYYLENESGVNRRMTNLLVERLVDGLKGVE